MCKTITKVYPCGHTTAVWHNCHKPEADPKLLGSVSSQICKLCDPETPALATITGWDTCLVRELQRTRSKWQCCRCNVTNSPDKPSCSGQVKSASSDDKNTDSWACQHNICVNCQGIGMGHPPLSRLGHTVTIRGRRTRTAPRVVPGKAEPGCTDETCAVKVLPATQKRKRNEPDDQDRTEKSKMRYLGPGWHREADPGFYLCFTDSENEDD
ncbi:hypothetical protein QBC37DRAFT_403408 [Rhypophila decipiens]|uniref:Uncharacterized protein n=1 Tax=Rhypophila decipiens TaxID=261697 RepID=A0AAN6Y337_9PEZI|nr:hypothetical protein QBC37DRAFT_403408 [Rhypophila decipiens]